MNQPITTEAAKPPVERIPHGTALKEYESIKINTARKYDLREAVRETRGYREMRSLSLWSVVLVILLLGGSLATAATIVLSGAVAASGYLVVETSKKLVQHPSGGVVAEILVRDGDHVREGQILIKLDETVARAAATASNEMLDQLTARTARLVSERDGRDSIGFPQSLTSRADDPRVREAMAAEVRQFEARRIVRTTKIQQLHERVTQLRDEAGGLTQQVKSLQDQLTILDSEIGGLAELLEKRIVSIQRVNALRREKANTEGTRSSALARISSIQGQIAEVELQILQVDQDLRSDTSTELRDVGTEMARVVERKAQAEDTLKRIVIRAPQSGVVHELAVHTVGGLAEAGKALMAIVPEQDTLIVSGKVQPSDIDQIYPGQSAILRFSSFDRTTTPTIDGAVNYVAADVTFDAAKGIPFYTVQIKIPPDQMERLGGMKLIAGMPVEAHIRTTDRTLLTYLIKPILDQITRSFRES